ncbi:hypothetical protein [Planotetraspora sp. GP83]|uniref:hypothetical protein n=1 Tax=Planotetraspora sp. GP83 TaxID=3156264 RepID=UPI003512F334
MPTPEFFDVLIQAADEVERAIVKSKLSPEEQDLLLSFYGHFAGKNSLQNVVILRLCLEGPTG